MGGLTKTALTQRPEKPRLSRPVVFLAQHPRNDEGSRLLISDDQFAEVAIVIYALSIILILIGAAASAGVLIVAGLDAEMGWRRGNN
ncbi:hypothetical protein I6F35_22980 [Bradyrhizobium sp. BRP22]|uniref:hypothetical protein n=1 Tax=Bradyrhizobium sp. BRP22 TaxID=2793821 RepID=UPI001CD312FD|nr:hypothetical protein [Bradyrhizobium sp. BRP22]MCA1456035.1 hypothetical protein [Bradyrhizobium sp. BRP22]